MPEPPPGLALIGPGHPMADIVHAHGCDIRPALTTYGPRSDGGPPVIEMGAAPRQRAGHPFRPVVRRRVAGDLRGQSRPAGRQPSSSRPICGACPPTVGCVICTTMQIGRDWFDEDHVVVDCEGRIIVQTRQLAMVPAP